MTFRLLNVQLMVLQLAEHLVQEDAVLVQGTRVQQDIVQVHKHALVQQIKEHMVHYTLEM